MASPREDDTSATSASPTQAQESFTDPGSRILQHRGGGSEPSCSNQAAVDRDARLDEAISTGNSPSEAAPLAPTALAAEITCGQGPEVILAGAGCRSEQGFQERKTRASRPS